MVIHDNLYAGVTLVSKKQKQIKTIECYEPIHEHNSYFNLMGHGAPSHHQGHHLAPLSPSLYSPTDDQEQLGTRWQHQRVPYHQSSHKDQILWRGARIMAQTVAMQRHAPLQTTQLHTAINAYFFNNSHISVDLNIKNFIVYLFFNIEVGTEWRRLLCSHQLVVLEHPSWRRPILIEVISI